jgi:hypothetical protein
MDATEKNPKQSTRLGWSASRNCTSCFTMPSVTRLSPNFVKKFVENPMTKVVYKRCSLTPDTETVEIDT